MWDELANDFYCELTEFTARMDVNEFILKCEKSKPNMTADEAVVRIATLKKESYPLFMNTWYDRKAFRWRSVMRSVCDEAVRALLDSEDPDIYIDAIAKAMWRYLQRLLSHSPVYSRVYDARDGSKRADADWFFFEMLSGYYELLCKLPGGKPEGEFWVNFEVLLGEIARDIRAFS